jgi:Phosphatidylinositol-specific phospholipase C, X domain
MHRRIAQALECPSAALAFNCCQFSCCNGYETFPASHKNDAFYSYNHGDEEKRAAVAERTKGAGHVMEDGLFYSWKDGVFPGADHPHQSLQWWENLTVTNPRLKCCQVVMPGTHDSASSSIGSCKPCSAVGRTQALTIQQQLQAGIRSLDIRIADKANSTAIWHGCLTGGSLMETVVTVIAKFLREHPNEFILVELVPEYRRKFSVANRLNVLEQIKEEWGSLLLNEQELRLFRQQWTLQDLLHSRKRLLVLLHPRYFEGFSLSKQEVADQYNMFQSRDYLINHWYDTRDVTTLLEQNVKTIRQPRQNRLICSQFVLTPGVSSLNDIWKALVGSASVQPHALAKSMYRSTGEFKKFWHLNSHYPWQVVALDYVNLIPGFIHYLIGLNGPRFSVCCAGLQIRKNNGQRQVIDVTKSISQFICRDCVLWMDSLDIRSLIDLHQDSPISRSVTLGVGAFCGVLTVAIKWETGHEPAGKWGKGSYIVWSKQVGNIGGDDEVVFSGLAWNRDMAMLNLTPSELPISCLQSKESGGFICGTRLYGTLAAAQRDRSAADGVILHYSSVHVDGRGSYKFDLVS